MSLSYVYILTNPAMPDWIKVGKADNVKKRIADLSSRTAVPVPFECYAYMEVPADLVFVAESSLHQLMGFSITKEKEFFRMSPEKALQYMRVLAPNNPSYKIVVHPDLETATEKKQSSSTTFSLLQIAPGSTLSWYHGEERIDCQVFDGSNVVIYNGQKTTVSAIAKEKLGYNVNGYRVFEYEDETLWDRRKRLNP